MGIDVPHMPAPIRRRHARSFPQTKTHYISVVARINHSLLLCHLLCEYRQNYDFGVPRCGGCTASPERRKCSESSDMSSSSSSSSLSIRVSHLNDDDDDDDKFILAIFSLLTGITNAIAVATKVRIIKTKLQSFIVAKSNTLLLLDNGT
mmetsp:Transcript_30423/g.45029  ORF Transcript_30423/g.45029 Transcript_30423/m.45029 type:complete len:149 (-) Transcript_30423:116-562(-)